MPASPDRRIIVSDGQLQIDGCTVPVGVYSVAPTECIVTGCGRVITRYHLTELTGVFYAESEAMDGRLGCALEAPELAYGRWHDDGEA